MLSKLLLVLLPFFYYAVAIFFPFKTFTRAEVKERELMKTAILDYVEGVDKTDTTRIYKSVHPSLVKRGIWYDKEENKYSSFQEMNFRQLVDLSRNWNKDGSKAVSNSPREVTVFDVQDKTASAKVVAAWGTDYLHLAKIDDRWYIMNVLSEKPDGTKPGRGSKNLGTE